GDVDDPRDLGHLLLDHDLDALAERHAGHAAALAAPRQPQVGRAFLDRHQLGAPAVGGDAGVDLTVEDLEHPLGDVAAQVGLGPGAGHPDGRARTVGIVEHEPALDRVAL